MNNFNLNTLLKSNDISQPVQRHLIRVYQSLSLTSLSSIFGIYLNHQYDLNVPLASLFSLLLLFGLKFTRDTQENYWMRFMMLMGFGLMQGLGLGPLIGLFLSYQPAIVLQASIGTLLIFLSFSGSALMSQRRSFFYLGSLLSSAVSILFFLSLFNIFFGSSFLFDVNLYIGLLAFIGFICFDTQMIVERASLGDRDHLGHAVDLFTDLVAVFVRILIILQRQQSNRQQRSRKGKERERDEF